MRVLVVVGAALALLLGAGGCTPSGPGSPSRTPTPAFSYAETQLQRQTRLDFEAAEKAYRTFLAEYGRLARAGGAKEPSQLMRDTGAGPILKQFATALRDQYEHHGKLTGTLKMVDVRRGGYEPPRLTLLVCEDGSGVRLINAKGKTIGKGSAGTATVEVRRLDGRWKSWNTSDDKAVSSCAG